MTLLDGDQQFSNVCHTTRSQHKDSWVEVHNLKYNTMTDTLPPPGSIESERISSKDKSKRGSKLKYLKYSPPSSAGPGPGAWRQAIGQAPTTTGGRRSSPDSSDLDFISLSLDVANVSLDFKDPSSPGGRVNWNSNQKAKNGKRKKKGGGGGTRAVISSAPTPSTPSDPLVFNGKWTRRSTSNRLLNCFTIDDCMARHRNKLALGHGGPEAWTTAKADLAYTLDTFPNPKHPMDDPPQTDGHQANDGTPRKPFPNGGVGGGSSRGSSARRTHRETSFGETYLTSNDSSMPLNNDNEALAKAMHTIMTSTEVVNNTARTGLFKSKRQRRAKMHQRHHPDQHQQNHQDRPESTRFRRMNDALHKWIDEEIILPRSRLGSMNSLRSQSQDNGVEGSTGGDGGGYSPNNNHQRHNTSTPHLDRYRGARSMDAPMEVLRRRPDASSRLRDNTRRPRSAEDNAGNAANDLHRGPHRSDSFLEMLMELDEDKRAPSGDDGGGLTTVADTETLDGSART